jgi:hypothetical protein
MDCFVASAFAPRRASADRSAPLRKRFAFVAGNDDKTQSSLRANGSRECAPDETKQSIEPQRRMDCFVASAPRNDDKTQFRDLAA